MTYEALLSLVPLLAAVIAWLAIAGRPRMQPARVVREKQIGQRFVATAPPGAGDGPA